MPRQPTDAEVLRRLEEERAALLRELKRRRQRESGARDERRRQEAHRERLRERDERRLKEKEAQAVLGDERPTASSAKARMQVGYADSGDPGEIRRKRRRK